MFDIDDFKANQILSLADNFLKLLNLSHKLRSKKPTHINSATPKLQQTFEGTENPEGTIIINSAVDPIDTIRTQIDEFYD